MTRRLTHQTLHVPTLTAPGEPRHIITRDDDPLCGAARPDGAEQWPPQPFARRDLCPRCVQRYIRQILGEDATW